MLDVVVVGAGCAGLMAAQTMESHGLNVAVLEQADRVGGRMATHEYAGGRADVGAQFFTAQTSEFETLIATWRRASLLFPWSMDSTASSLDPIDDAGLRQRYMVFGGMQSLAEHIARGLADVRLNARVLAIRIIENGWRLQLDGHDDINTRAVVLALPAPIALRLVDAGGVRLTDTDRSNLEAIEYRPSIAAVFHVDGKVNLPPLASVRADNVWLADNLRKGISPQAHLVTLQAWGEAAMPYLDEPADAAQAFLLSCLTPYLSEGATVKAAYTMSWQEAQAVALHAASFIHAAQMPPLVFCGDGFARNRVEGAVLSGIAAGENIAVSVL